LLLGGRSGRAQQASRWGNKARQDGGQTATYRQIQNYTREKYGYLPRTCWIAHSKELSGVGVGRAPDRKGKARTLAWPAAKLPDLQEAFDYFGMLEFEPSEIRAIRVAERELSQFETHHVEELADALALLSISVDVLQAPQRGCPTGEAKCAPPPSDVAYLRIEEPPAVAYSMRRPTEDWWFAPTSGFRKSAQDTDTKLMGKVLRAINDLCRKPMELRGDTAVLIPT